MTGEPTVLVHVPCGSEARDGGALEELRALARSTGAEIVGEVTGRRERPEARYYVGTGKAEEIRAAVAAAGADLVVVNHALSPSQERNLERLLKARVLDRAGLILDIFARRARSHEGKLQVELAQLDHLATRLVRGWTHLERQRGGIGLRGPGETQLETDRRLLAERVRQLRRRLEDVRRHRHLGRRARRRAQVATVALVGYTNAGKSTLFNALTAAGVHAADQLFATLDPTLRRIAFGNGGQAILADTVGFIRDLPHELVAAFRATLEETAEATLLVHVIDAASGERDLQVAEVHAVLGDIGAETVPRIEVMNKIDAVEGLAPRIDRDADGVAQRVWVSAATGQGMDLLLDALAERLAGTRRRVRLRVPAGDGRARAAIFRSGGVLSETVEADGECVIEAELDATTLARLRRAAPEVSVVA